MFDAWARPRLLLIAVHATGQSHQKSVALGKVRSQLLNLVVARPCFIHLFSSFVKSAHLQPKFVIDGPVGEEMLGEFDEHVFMSCFSESFQTSSKHDVGSLVSEIETAAALRKIVESRFARVLSEVFPPGTGVQCISSKRSLEKFQADGKVVDALELIEVFGVSPQNNEHVFKDSMQSFFVSVHDLQIGQAAPVSLVGKIVEDGLTGVLLGPSHVFGGALGVGLGQTSELLRR